MAYKEGGERGEGRGVLEEGEQEKKENGEKKWK